MDTLEMIARMFLVNAVCDALEDFVVIHFIGLAMPSGRVLKRPYACHVALSINELKAGAMCELLIFSCAE